MLLEIEQTKYDLSTTKAGEIAVPKDGAKAKDLLNAFREKLSWLGIKIECDAELDDPSPIEAAEENGRLLDRIKQFADAQELSLEIGPGVVHLAKTQARQLYTVVYRVPTNFLEDMRRPDGQKKELAPDPFAPQQANDGPNGLIANDARQLLESWGVEFEKGAEAWFAPHRSRVVIHNTPAQLKIAEAAINGINEGVSKQIRIQTDLFALPARDALELKAKYRGSSDYVEMVQEIYEAMSDGDRVRIIGSVSIIAKSGQRAKSEANSFKNVTVDYEDVGGQEKAVQEMFRLGHMLEVDPIIGADGVTIDLNVAPEFLVGEPTFTPRKIVGPVSGESLEVFDVDHPTAKFTTSATLQSGQTLLLGSSTKDVKEGPQVLLCFLSADIVLSSR
ncbi:MAG: hypothetical protein AAF585_01430 [Verrucomicrobiota bacterium]